MREDFGKPTNTEAIIATIGSLVFELSANVARLQQDMAKARSTVEGAMAGITSAVDLAKSALAGIGVGVSIAGFQQMIMGAIEGEAALHKLNLQTGISVELLSALRPVAKQAGTDIDTVAGMVNKLEKNMTTFAQTGGGKAADAFKQLGYSQADVQKGLKNMDAFLPEFAKRLTDAGVGGEQAGLAMQLMAKGGAAALPFLKQLAEAGELHAKITGDQAAAAHEFEVNLVKLQGAANKLKYEIANTLIPSLNAIAVAMLDARKAGEGFFGSLIMGAREAAIEMFKPRLESTLQLLASVRTEMARVQNQPYVNKDQLATLRQQEASLEKTRNTLVDMAKFSEDMKEPEKKKKDIKEVDKKPKDVKDRTAEYEKAARDMVAAEMDAAKEVSEAWKFWEQIQLKNHQETTDAWALQWKQVFAEIDAEQERAIADGKDYLDALNQKTKETHDGMKELGFVMSSAFENAIVKGEGLRSVLGGMLQDIAKIIIRKSISDPIAGALSGAAGDFFKGLFPGKASGGPVSGGSPYMVGEAGPELFVPSGSGTIIPNGAGGGSVTQHVTIQIAQGSNPQDYLAVLLPAMRGIARSEIVGQLRPGGAFA